MKKILLLLLYLCIVTLLHAQYRRIVNVTAGGLDSALTAFDNNDFFELTIIGTIDARDFRTLRDEMPDLMMLDLSVAVIMGYSGTEGTVSANISYPANTIPENAFYRDSIGENRRLTVVELPFSLNAIGNSAFKSCVGLSGVFQIPGSVTSIGDFAFYACTSLTLIDIPASVTNIGYRAFYFNSGFFDVEIGNQSYSSINGVLFNRESTTLIQCPISKTGSYTVPSSVNSIGSYAFYGCKGLTSIAIPSSVTTIQDSAFVECDNITYILADGTSPINLDSTPHALISINKTTCTLYVPVGTKATYQSANQWKDFLTIVERGSDTAVVTTEAGKLGIHFSAACRDTVKTLTILGAIDARDFKFMRDNLPCLTELNIEDVNVNAYSGTEGTAGTDSITYSENQIPKYAFFDRNNRVQPILLTSIILPSTLTSIGELSFYVCRDLTTVVIQPSVNSILNTAFGGCSKLKSIDIPSSVTHIGTGAFMTSGLASVIIPSSIDTISKSVFRGCRELKNVTIPQSVIVIDSEAFADCDSLTSCTIPTSVTSIGSYAFCYNRSLDSLYIPSSVTNLGEASFTDCTGLRSVLIPSSVTSIGKSAFRSCSGSITVDPNNQNYSSLDGELFNKDKTTLIHCSVSKIGKYIIPSSVDTIGNHAFSKCSLLTTIIIPSSITDIDDWAFRECIGLTSIVAQGASPVNLQSSTYVFYKVNKTTCTLYVPFGSKHLYETADQWKDFTHIVEMPVLSLSDTALTIPAVGGNDTIEINSNTTWEAVSDQPWLSVSPATGSGNMSLIITVEANPSPITRVALVTVSADGVENQFVTVTQEALSTTETLLASSLLLTIASEEGSTANVTITANIPWTAMTDKDWLTLTPASDSGSVTITFTANANTSFSERQANVTILATDGYLLTITVIQSAGNVLNSDAISNARVILYPNPVTEGFLISGLEDRATVVIADLSGKTLLSTEINGDEYIPANFLAKGLHIVRIYTAKGQIEKKLIKQ